MYRTWNTRNRANILPAVLGLLLLACGAAVCQAQDDSPNETAKELIVARPPRQALPPWEASLDGIWWPRQDSERAGGSVGLYETRAKLARTLRLGRQLSLTPELSYSRTEISAPPAALLPRELHSASLGLRADFFASPQWSYSLFVAPTLAGDFRAIGADDLQVRLGLIGRYVASSKLVYLAGLIYQPGNHSLQLLPIMGAIYRPDERWTIGIAAPRPGVSYAATKQVKLQLGGEFTSAEYQLHQQILGARVISYRDFRVLGGVEFELSEIVKAEVAAGYAFGRNISFYEEVAANRPDLKIDPGVFGRAGVKFAW
jgi:hypothetical protein